MCNVTGLAAGQDFTQSGGSSTYQCLPKEPEYSKYVEGYQIGTYIYGAEYETEGHIFDASFNNQNVPCARCYVPTRITTIMIPAKRNCPSSWTKVWYTYSILMVYSWYIYGILMVCSKYTHGILMVYSWYSYDILMVYLW